MIAVRLKGVLAARQDRAKGAQFMLLGLVASILMGTWCAYLAANPDAVGWRAEDWTDPTKILFFGFFAVFFLAPAPFELLFWLALTGRLATLYCLWVGSTARLGSPTAILLGRALRIAPGETVAVNTERLPSIDMPGSIHRFRWRFTNGTKSTHAFVLYGMPDADLERFTEALAAEGVSVSFPS